MLANTWKSQYFYLISEISELYSDILISQNTENISQKMKPKYANRNIFKLCYSVRNQLAIQNVYITKEKLHTDPSTASFKSYHPEDLLITSSHDIQTFNEFGFGPNHPVSQAKYGILGHSQELAITRVMRYFRCLRAFNDDNSLIAP